MATSKIRVYQTEITPDRNAKVDNIDDYLNSLTPAYSNDNFQYQRIGLDMVVKIPVSQSNVGQGNFNYVVIEQDGRRYYFFVLGANWRSVNCIELVLSIDSINTYWDDLNWNPKTTIQRQHQDRWYKSTNISSLVKRIDKYNEGLNPTLNEFKSKTKINYPNEAQEHKWYLIYKTRDGITVDNTTNPVSAMLLADKELLIEPAINNKLLVKPIQQYWADNNWTSTSYVFITDSGLVNASIKIESQVIQLDQYNASNNDFLRVMRIELDGYGQLVIKGYWYTGDSYPYAYNRETTLYRDPTTPSYNITFTNIDKLHVSNKSDFYKNLHSLNVIDSLGGKTIDSGVIPTKYTIPFSELDRSNSTFMRILELPYPPCDIIQIASYFPVPDGWNYNPGFHAYEAPLEDQNFTSNLASINIDAQLTNKIVAPIADDEWLGSDMETKLASSEFNNLSLVYDANTLNIPLERFEPHNVTSTNKWIQLQFQVSNAMSSNMLFKWSLMNDAKYSFRSQKLYDTTMISTRNIEKPIYSSGYVDYLRNGFNYDNETTKRQVRNQTINAVVSGTQAGVNIISPIADMISAGNATKASMHAISGLSASVNKALDHPSSLSDYAITILGGNLDKLENAYDILHQQRHSQLSQGRSIAAGVIGQGISAVNSAINSAISIDSTKRQFAQTLQNNQVATAGLSSTADTDLLNSYADGNKLYLYNYSISSYDANNIAKVFYYCGYSHPVQEIPNTTSRLWFNFIQCNAVFNDEQTSVYTNYLNDIKTRLAAGVTVYHAVAGDYDWNQIKENYETWIPDWNDIVSATVNNNNDHLITWTKDSRNQYNDDGVNIYYEIQIIRDDDTAIVFNTEGQTNARQFTVPQDIMIKAVQIRKRNNNFHMIGSWTEAKING